MTETFTAPHDLDLALTAYADALEQMRAATYAAEVRGPIGTAVPRYVSRYVSITFERGSKYLRVVVSDGFGSRSAYAFIVTKDTDKFKVGDILKAASWKAPAKNYARGNVFKPETYAHHSPYEL